jgi:hypothetical protein
MKQIYILLFLFSLIVYSQNKTIVPTKGAIVFVCKTTITDQVLFDQSKKEFKKKFFESFKSELVFEQLSNGVKKVDTAKVSEAVKVMEMTLGGNFEQDVFKDYNGYQYHHEFQDSLIKEYKINHDVKEDFFTINSKTKAFVNNTGNGNYEYSSNRLIEMKEFKNETKIINGYKCFKVIYNYSEPDLGEFSTLMSQYIHKRELWVTDKINVCIHPIINDAEILEKYYPLEITEYSDRLKGSVKEYRLVSLKIN